jgi:thiamine pyrophosphokinase
VPAAIVFAAAPVQPTPRLKRRVASLESPFVVAADGGAATALAFGLTPDVVIGDFDSLAPSALSDLNDLKLERYPRDKDFTDGELAIRRALDVSPQELWLIGFLGGPRLDQALANVMLLTHIEIPATLLDERNECRLVRAGVPYAWRPETGEIVSLIATSGPVTGVTTRGLRWRLANETLRLGQTRGVSNEPVAEDASVSVDGGLLLVTRHFAAL